MNGSLFFYSALILNLIGCQQMMPQSFSPPIPAKTQIPTNQLKQLLKYNKKFTAEFAQSSETACIKYKRLHQQGDWQASWLLAFNASTENTPHCLKNKEAINILKSLKTDKKLDPEIRWLNNFYLPLQQKLQNQNRKVWNSQKTINKNQKKILELEQENQDIKQKLDALKAL